MAVAFTELVLNPGLDRSRGYGERERAILNVERGKEAYRDISAWSGYAPTPLRSLAGLARACEVGAILYKDEGCRFGLGSFKALGGAYAVERLAENYASGAELIVTTATDGNHGRAVAWGANRIGARAIIYVHETVSEGREHAIAAYGAEVRREGRLYDDAVEASAEAARANGWQLVSDTSWHGYEDVPRSVMQGYSVLILEALAQGAAPTHIFVQGGVGGLAAAILAWIWEREGAARPKVVIVEPDKAACLMASAKAGSCTKIGGDLDTIMAGLSCAAPSLLAWQILWPGADAFMAIPDEAAAESMRDLARKGIVGGESGVAGLAGLRAVAADADARRAIALDETSRVLCFGTEGATDPEVYRRIVGQSADSVELRGET